MHKGADDISLAFASCKILLNGILIIVFAKEDRDSSSTFAGREAFQLAGL